MACRIPLALSLILVLLTAAAVGCVRDAQESDASDLKDRLRSLPYVAYSNNPAESDAGVVRHDVALSHPGCNLYVARSLCRADLIDETGEVLHTWRDDGFDIWQDFELLPDGSFLVLGRYKAPEGGKHDDPFGNRALLKLSAGGEKIFETPVAAHHEIHHTPGRPLATLLFRWREIPAVHRSVPVLDNRLATISDTGEVLDSVSLHDLLHRTPDFEMQRVKAAPGPNGEFVDLLHANTVEWIEHASDEAIFAPGNLLVTIRHQDAVVIVDWEAKEIVWSWGPDELSGPHDATVLENGHILIFDNGLGRDWSRVIELDPLTKHIVWEYRAPEPKDFYTATRGTSQRLANGNTLITESNDGRAFEITPAGEIVWEYHTPHRDAKGRPANIIRMRRYEREYVVGFLGERP